MDTKYSVNDLLKPVSIPHFDADMLTGITDMIGHAVTTIGTVQEVNPSPPPVATLGKQLRKFGEYLPCPAFKL